LASRRQSVRLLFWPPAVRLELERQRLLAVRRRRPLVPHRELVLRLRLGVRLSLLSAQPPAQALQRVSAHRQREA
jgi:hypothetical protein